MGSLVSVQVRVENWSCEMHRRDDVRRVIASVAVVLISLAGGTTAAGLDCAKASTPVERMICDDPALSRMDSELNALYSQQLRTAAGPSAFREEQQVWVRRVRDACDSVSCLTIAYKRRNYALVYGSEWMTGRRAAAICQSVLEAANDGSLADRFVSIPYEGKIDEAAERYKERVYPDGGYGVGNVLRLEHRGRVRTLGQVGGGGTCSACEIVDLDGFGAEMLPEDDEEENLRWASWGDCDNLLIEDDELILVKTDQSEVGLVSWLGPDRATRPLCLLAPVENDFSVSTIEARDKEMCEAVAKGGVEVVSWGPEETVTPEQRARFRRVDSKTGSVEIDLNVDGQVDRVQMFDYASGAGCGSYHQWLSAEPASADSGLETTLRKLGGPLQGVWSSETAGGAGAMRVFRYKDKPYVLARGETGNAVYSVWRNQLERWCQYRYLPRHTIKVIYPPESWPAPSESNPQANQ